MKFNYRIYVAVALILLVMAGWLSIVSAFAIVLLGVLFSIEHNLRMINLMMIVMMADQLPDVQKNNVEDPNANQ